MRQLVRTFTVASLAFFLNTAQTLTTARQAREAVAARITVLSSQLRFRGAAGFERYRAVRDELTSEIHGEVDAYIAQAFDAAHAESKAVEQDLNEILTAQRDYYGEYCGPPFARVLDLPNGRSLLVAYPLVRANGSDPSATVRGYRMDNGRFRLTATARYPDGYGLFIAELHSPIPSEIWTLAWGPAYGYNGTKVEIVIYAYDGNRLRTVWIPGTVLNTQVNGTIRVNKSGFTVQHLDEQRYYVIHHPPYSLEDSYVLMLDGPHKVSSHYLPE